MATQEQIDGFSDFARRVSVQEGAAVPLDEIYSRWRQECCQEEDLAAIREAAEAYEQGERGMLARAELAEFRDARAAGAGP